MNAKKLKELDRDFCPYCDERVKRCPTGVDVCPDHGVLDGISDQEWRELEEERGV
jgi:hypothetical protein